MVAAPVRLAPLSRRRACSWPSSWPTLPPTARGWVWDDREHVVANENLRSVDGLHRTWFEPRSLPQYHPLVHTPFWFEYQLWEAPAGRSTRPTRGIMRRRPAGIVPPAPPARPRSVRGRGALPRLALLPFVATLLSKTVTAPSCRAGSKRIG
jgi:hypothetical protein